MTRSLTIIWLLTVFVLMTGCSHIKKTCSFQLEFIDNTPSDIGNYSLVEIDGKELLQSAPWGVELYSDALTNVNSMAMITKESLRRYRLFLKDLKCLGIGGLMQQMESIMPRELNCLPELDVQVFLQKCTSVDNLENYYFENMISLSRNLASWIWALQKHSWTVEEFSSNPMLSNLYAIYSNGGIADILSEDYWNESKRIHRLQLLTYACVLSERYPMVKRLYVDENYKIRYVPMQHGRVPLPVSVEVVDERKFVFKDCNLTPFAELTMCFDYGYFGCFKEVNMDSKMVLDMAFRALLHRYNKGFRIKGEICHNLETGEIKVDVREFAK